ncbi:DUF5047 domain-containing protein [Streptomyces hydrogenans]|uniref:DUF5047 domain-containing protein n=1 Tax=Streptomyces hydrogenans TaxID=1873719 RepID=A0ABQ3PJS3_9ACTN|nr:DUF5047 domain-containing protein [Streptomyces hydrogenans]GHG09673.1 hypothetical protein GCM10018784_22810 [Streptomyces hydrogenans]GHI25267.1 hypothetical protein Shyd_66380 [Streptomyces hydrogenans]
MGRQSDRFYRSIRESHQIISWIDAITPDQEVIRLPAIDGQVDVDRSAAVRRKLSCQCIDPTGLLTPRANGEVLTPYGTELRAYRGVRYSSAEDDWEVCPLGVFRLSKSSISESNTGSPIIQLEAYDRARSVARDKFKTPYTITTGTNAMTALKTIIKMTFPDCQFDTITSTVTTTAPLLYEAGSDPWEAVYALARSMGCEVFFDVEGRLAVLPPHDPNALPSPDFTYVEGQGSTMLELGKEFNDEGVYNGVIVVGESVGDQLPPVRGEAWDENPTSPTYRLGPYGEVPLFITDNLAKTEEQATAIAKAQLALVLGAASKLAITCTVNATYECGDIVRVKRAKSKVDGLYSVEAFSVPLRGMTQALTLREQRPTP